MDITFQDLDEGHQEALLSQMLRDSPASTWTAQNLKKALRLAPNIIDDDLIEELDDDLVSEK